MEKGKRHATSDNDKLQNTVINWQKYREVEEGNEAARAADTRLRKFVKKMRILKVKEGGKGKDLVEQNEEFLGFGSVHFQLMKSMMEYETNIEHDYEDKIISKEERDRLIFQVCKDYHRMEEEIGMKRSEMEHIVEEYRAAKKRNKEDMWDRETDEYVVNLADF